MKLDVVVYGNLVLDTVFDNFECTYTLGGIANVWYSIQKIDMNISITLVPICIGQALIYLDSDTGFKVSKPSLQNKVKEPKLLNSTFSHIAYLNHLPNLDFIKNIKSDFISADLAPI